jgi:hypothetical protein
MQEKGKIRISMTIGLDDGIAASCIRLDSIEGTSRHLDLEESTSARRHNARSDVRERITVAIIKYYTRLAPVYLFVQNGLKSLTQSDDREVN